MRCCANRFYVFTHPQILPSLQARFDAVLNGKPPADPYTTRPGARPPSPVELTCHVSDICAIRNLKVAE